MTARDYVELDSIAKLEIKTDVQLDEIYEMISITIMMFLFSCDFDIINCHLNYIYLRG